MSRQPVHLERVGGKGPRQRMWELIRQERSGFTEIQLSRQLRIHLKTVETFMDALCAGGFILGNGEKIRSHRRYILSRDNGAHAPRVRADGTLVTQGSGTEAMWQSMRVLGDFDYRELAAFVRQAGVKVSDSTAGEYVISLSKAGYLNTTRQPKPGLVGRYKLIAARYSGPRPPMIQRTKAVFDPNLNKVVWQQKISEEVLDDC